MLKILVFDQHPRSRDLYRREFEAEGYDVITACSLRHALKVFRSEAPALVLLSIERPGAELLGTIEQMLSADRRIPIVFTGPVAENADSGCLGSATLHPETETNISALKRFVRELCPPPVRTMILSRGARPALNPVYPINRLGPVLAGKRKM